LHVEDLGGWTTGNALTGRSTLSMDSFIGCHERGSG